MITRAKLVKEIGSRLEALELSVEGIKIKGFNRETGIVKQVIVTTNYNDSGINVAGQIRDIFDNIYREYGVGFDTMYLDL